MLKFKLFVKKWWLVMLLLPLLFLMCLSFITALVLREDESKLAILPQTQTVEVQELGDIKRSDLLADINSYRTTPLKMSDKLNQSAQLKANDMKKNNYWAHNSPAGVEPWTFFDKAGYQYSKAGENLAKCYVTAKGAVTAWYNSPEHQKNILGDYTETGFGMVKMDNCIVIVNHFGRPL